MKIVRQKICDEIRRQGILPFARFMELALYSPDGGYYEQEKNPGRRGDFFTSVSVGNLFGELLAFQFAEWLEEMPPVESRLSIAEAGAHDGKLAADILNWLQVHREKLFSKIEYAIIEPSPTRRRWQEEMLKKFSGKISWISHPAKLKNRQSAIGNSQFSGIMFSNELLDAFPVHRLGWDAKNKKWFEWGVALDGEKFVWAKTENSQFKNFNSELPSALLQMLPDNFTIEISPAATNWWHEAVDALNSGKLLALDYGFTTEEQFSPARANGTLRGYFQHRIADDILANPGEQDLTAHVNFSVLRQIGEDAGLITEFFQTQSKFLTEILAQAARSQSFEWDRSRTRQFQTLTHPEHLGRAFRVMLQSR